MVQADISSDVCSMSTCTSNDSSNSHLTDPCPDPVVNKSLHDSCDVLQSFSAFANSNEEIDFEIPCAKNNNEDKEDSMINLDNMSKHATKHKSMRNTVVPVDPATQCSLQLMTMLQSANAPKCLHAKIIHWMKENSKVIHESEKLPNREQVIDNLSLRHDLKCLCPIQVKCELKGTGGHVNLTCHSFSAAVSSLLLDPDLMQSKNLLFENASDPSLFDPDKLSNIADVNTGTAFKNSVMEFCTA